LYVTIQAWGQGAQGALTVERMCELVGVSRAGYYRDLAEHAPDEEEMAVRAVIQEIALQHRRHYGRRRITQEMRNRGMVVNQKRVGRLMREDNLLAIRRRQFVKTTDSQHELEIYLNVAAHMQLTGINQLWVADITYIRLRGEFVFLAVVLDRFSRCAVGWSLDRNLTVRLTIAALQQAIEKRQPQPGLVHHSDRGMQYAAREYVEILQKHGMIPSMSRPANPYDNATCERFMKTLKEEEIDGREYRDQGELEAHLEEFIDRYYNRQRLHSALGYKTPEEFERSLSPPAGFQPPTARLSFPLPTRDHGRGQLP
jgi:transposase InsO family protein